ncbi:hypothetical protein NVP1063O_020 [Vibrio phage 1.063.O._10N.261.45.C7]|nr:hypothetical protein NVP1063O_020 [Vibrio phage 1.063.O._10N.261.45.C7]
MAKRLTEAIIKERVNLIEHDKNVKLLGLEDFKGCRTKLILKCNVCSFTYSTVRYMDFERSKGCTKCTNKRKSLELKDNLSSFVEKSRIRHGNLFNYDDVEYVDSKTPVSIFCINCNEHFNQAPSNHLNGQGCRCCANIKLRLMRLTPFSDFLQRAEKVHKGLYSYSGESFKGIRELVEITCQVHGKFSQLSYSHLRGSGCPLCATSGFDRNKPANLYVVVWSNGMDNFIKVGITNNKVEDRVKMQSIYTKYTPEKITSVPNKDGRLIYNLESEIKKKFPSGYMRKEDFPDGYTETFPYSCYRDIMAFINTRMETY